MSDSYCSLAAHKPAGLGYLLKGGYGLKVGEQCPLATSHQMARKVFLGCQEPALSTCRHAFSLRIATCVTTPCLPLAPIFPMITLRIPTGSVGEFWHCHTLITTF